MDDGLVTASNTVMEIKLDSLLTFLQEDNTVLKVTQVFPVILIKVLFLLDQNGSVTLNGA